jgi:hypothetical protein
MIGVTTVSYSDIHTEFRNAYTDWDALAAKYGGSSLLPADCAKVRGTLGIDYTRNEDGLCWYEFSKFRLLYPEYKDVSDKELSKRLYAKAGKPLIGLHPWVKLAKTVTIAIGVPLAFLALGWSLFWALAGFKSPTPVAAPGEPQNTGDAS